MKDFEAREREMIDRKVRVDTEGGKSSGQRERARVRENRWSVEEWCEGEQGV